MGRKLINPFKNESECLQLGELTIENRTDRVSIYGSIDITRDKEGLALARQLKQVLEVTLTELERIDLPEHISVETPDIVKNPFE